MYNDINIMAEFSKIERMIAEQVSVLFVERSGSGSGLNLLTDL